MHGILENQNIGRMGSYLQITKSQEIPKKNFFFESSKCMVVKFITKGDNEFHHQISSK